MASENTKTNYFAFMDESGNSRQERFFGLGLLLVPDHSIGQIYDSIKPYSDKIFDNSKRIKLERITNLKEQKEIDQLAEIANSSKRFELKFTNINYSNNLLYKALIQKYFEFKDIRFCALILDRLDPKFPRSEMEPWDIYIHRAAMLLANNIKNICPCNITLLADDLTKPKNITKTFERSLKDAIGKKLSTLNINNPMVGITRLESHASLMIQMVDVMLGAVMYDYKKQMGLISEKLGERQDIVADEIRKILGEKTIAANKTFHNPNYFSVWKFQK
jgi:hypothetical protein